MSRKRTWWHLQGNKRRPTEYDIATTRLLYTTDRELSVTTPVSDWLLAHRRARPLECRDWDAFRDPRETTYTKYTEIQHNREIFVDGLFALADDGKDDARLSAHWLATLDRILAPLRFPVHGLQMITAYVGSISPGGRIVVACLMQAADEVRRVQRIAYRLRLLQRVHPGFASDSRERWERDPVWQPLREVIERLLVVWNWDEAFVALATAVKPAFDELFMVRFGALASKNGDSTLGQMLRSLNEDCVWHREWSSSLVQLLGAEHAGNASFIADCRETWRARIDAAIAPFDAMFAELGETAASAGGER